MAAGFTDAIGFVELGGFFTSFMSGNTTQMGIEISTHGLAAVALPAGLILFFFLGGFSGSLLDLWPSKWANAATPLLVAALVACAFALDRQGFPPEQALLFLAASAGAQNAILSPHGSARLGATFVTGTLFMASQELARALRQGTHHWLWAQHILVWGALLFGALFGAVFHASFGLNALVVPLAIYFAFFLRAAIILGREP